MAAIFLVSGLARGASPELQPAALQAASDPQEYELPQYDLMDMMVRDVPYEEVAGLSEGSFQAAGEEPRADEANEEGQRAPEANLVPLSQLYNSLGVQRDDSLASLTSLTSLAHDGPVCGATLPHSERMLLTLNALAYHGSTALHQALMSSPKVATMCVGNHWQCEVSLRTPAGSRCSGCHHVVSNLVAKARVHDKIHATSIKRFEKHNDTERALQSTKMSFATSGLPCFACEGEKEEKRGTPCAKRTVEQSLAGNMRLFEPYWERQSNRSILLVKWAPLSAMGGACPLMSIDDDKLKAEGIMMPELPPGEVHTFGSSVIPASMLRAGVNRLRWATVFMHRPWCMWRASSHSAESGYLGRGTTDQEIMKWARRELLHLENLVQQHQRLAQRGAAVLVVNSAEMIHDFPRFNARLHAFAPCLGGKLESDYTPKMGADIFSVNQLKTGGTLKEYAKTHKTNDWKLDSKSLVCNEPPEKLYEGLNETEMIRAQAAEEYLLELAAASPNSLGAAQAKAEAARLYKIKSAYDILDAIQQAKDDKAAEKRDTKERKAAEKAQKNADRRAMLDDRKAKASGEKVSAKDESVKAEGDKVKANGDEAPAEQFKEKAAAAKAERAAKREETVSAKDESVKPKGRKVKAEGDKVKVEGDEAPAEQFKEKAAAAKAERAAKREEKVSAKDESVKPKGRKVKAEGDKVKVVGSA